VSPILVRPVREQLEHDRIIRLLQARLKRRHDVAINVGEEQAAGVKVGAGQMFPDLVLTSQDKGKRLEGIVEVETGESVNHLEAMAQWAHFGRVRAPFHLYVPAVAVEIARRLCTENQVDVAELWSFHTIGDQTRFTLVQRSASAAPRAEPRSARPEPKSVRPEPKAAESRKPEPAKSNGGAPGKRPTATRKDARPARKTAPARGAKARTGRSSAAASRKSARTQRRK
jgi:hypothetical protein